MSSTANLSRVEKDIREERARQDAKWGQQNHPPAVWGAILSEEVGELAQAILAELFGAEDHSSHHEDMRTEAIQVAAVAIAFVECLDRRAAGASEETTSVAG